MPAELVVDNGLCLIEEYPEMRTNIRIGTGDLDVSAAYPTNQVVMNVSKETTSKEITDIKNITKYSQKMHGINLSGGHTNAIEFCTGMLNFPELTVMLEEFNKSNGDSEIVTTV